MRRAVLFLLLVACGDEVVVVQPPPIEGHRSLLLVLERARSRSIHAIDMDRPDFNVPYPKAEPTDSDVAPQILALSYLEPLDQLGLTAGLLPQISADQGRPPPLPEEAWRVTLGEKGAGPWQPEVISDALIEGLTLPGQAQALCDERQAYFQIETTPLTPPPSDPREDQQDGRFAIRLDDNRALLATQDFETGLGRFYFAERGAVTPTFVDPSQPGALIGTASGYRAPDGTLWLGSSRGELWSGKLGGTFSIKSRTPSGISIDRMSGPNNTSEALELFTLSFYGALHHFDGAQWRLLSDGGELSGGGVARLGPGSAIYALSRSASLERYDMGQRQELDPGAGAVELKAILQIDGLGLVVGTEAGAVHLLQNDRWQRIGGFEFGSSVAIAPYEDGFVVGGSGGFFGQYIPGVGFCEQRLAPSEIVQILPMGVDRKDLLIVMKNKITELTEDHDDPTNVSWFSRVR